MIKWMRSYKLSSPFQVTVVVNAESVSVTLTTQEVLATALWTPPPVWPVTNRSVTVGAPASAACVNVLTQSFRVQPVKSAQRALEFVLNTSELLTEYLLEQLAQLEALNIFACVFPHRDCVQCRAFGTDDKKETCDKECSYFNLVTHKKKEELPQPNDQPYINHCKERDANDCWFFFTYATKNDSSIEVHVADELGKWRKK